MKKGLSILIALMLMMSLGCALGEETFLLTAPNGAPALAVATAAVEMPDSFRFVAADTIAAAFSANESDFVIAPINAGAKLYRAGKSGYRLAAVVTWGNLVFASQRENFTAESIQGNTITLFGENTINASIALYVLKEKGIVPGNIEYLAGAANTQQLLLSDPESIVLTAEPAVTAARMKNEKVSTVALNDLYEEITGYKGFAQAGLFISEKTISEKGKLVSGWIEVIRKAVEETVTDPEKTAKAAVALEILQNEKVAEKAIPNCGLLFVDALEARERIEQTVKIDPAQYGGDVPDDSFYYAEKK